MSFSVSLLPNLTILYTTHIHENYWQQNIFVQTYLTAEAEPTDVPAPPAGTTAERPGLVLCVSTQRHCPAGSLKRTWPRKKILPIVLKFWQIEMGQTRIYIVCGCVSKQSGLRSKKNSICVPVNLQETQCTCWTRRGNSEETNHYGQRTVSLGKKTLWNLFLLKIILQEILEHMF